MILNPFFLLLIYLIANTFAFFKLINLGGFNVFGYFWSVPIEISIISYMLQILFLLIIYVFYKLNFTRNYKVFYVTPVWGYIGICIKIVYDEFFSGIYSKFKKCCVKY